MSKASRTRATRKLEADTASLTKSDKLLLAQAVYEYGGDAWPQISEKLAKHSLISRPGTFTPQSCAVFYAYLMQEAEMEITNESSKIKSQVNKRLAERLFYDRLQELKDLIATEETIFKEKTREIEEIRTGQWDDKILGKAEPSSPTHQPEDTLHADKRQATPPPPSPSTLPEEIEPKFEILLDEKDEDRDEVPAAVLPDIIVIDEDAEPKPEPDLGLKVPGDPPADAVEQSADDAQVVELPQEESAEDSVPANPAEEDAEIEMEAEDLVEQDGSDSEDTPATSPRKRKESPGEESPQDSKRLRDESEAPDDDDEGLSAAPSRRRRTHAGAPADKKFQTLILGLHQQIHQHKCGAIFHHPIKPSDAPDYPLLIHRPVDLKTIKARVRSGEISNSVEYRRDIALMFANAMMFNRPSSDVYKMAEEMNNDVEEYINDFRQTEGFHRGR